MLYPADGPSQGFYCREHGNKGIYFKGTRELRSGKRGEFWGTGNIGNDDFDFGQQGNKAIEPKHDTTKNDSCARRRHRSAWESAQSDQPSLCSQWVATDPKFFHADNEDSNQTGWMPRLT